MIAARRVSFVEWGGGILFSSFLVSFSESDFPPGLFFSSFDADNGSGEAGAPEELDCAELKF